MSLAGPSNYQVLRMEKSDENNPQSIGVEGKTLYKVGDKQFTVEKGDVLHIPKNTFHSGIGLSPRIILSFAIRN